MHYLLLKVEATEAEREHVYERGVSDNIPKCKVALGLVTSGFASPDQATMH